MVLIALLSQAEPSSVSAAVHRGTWALALILALVASGCGDDDASEAVLTCPPGTHLSTDATNNACLACNAGEYCAGGTAQPTACDGLVEDHDSDPATPCSVVAGTCPAGTEQVTTAQGIACETCSSGTWCEGGLSSPVACADLGLADHDNDPSTGCQLVPGSCPPGTVEVGTGAAAICEACDAGEYCAGGAQGVVVCADADLIDHDNDPTTACGVPPGTCAAGTEELLVDGVPTCVECLVGAFCAGGLAANVPCGADEWDEDLDSATACVAQTQCGLTEHVDVAGSAVTNRTCAPCSANQIASAPNSETCDTWSLNGVTDEPTYRVEIQGVMLAPFDDHGDEWDGVDWASTAEWDALQATKADYSGTFAWLGNLQAAGTHAVPEVYGNARVSVHGFPEAEAVLNPETAPLATFRPRWTGRGFEHVPIDSSTRILVSLYDDDGRTDDALTYFIIDGAFLQAVADFGGPAASRIYNIAGDRALWVEMTVSVEGPGQNQFAPRAIEGTDVAAADAYTAPSGELHTLWIHGLDSNGGDNVVLNWAVTTYWAATGGVTGPSPFAVNYHARAYLNVSNVVLEYAMDRYCIAPESCVLACHSAGCAQSGFALARRSSFGERWNVERVIGGGSAAGGSESADAFAWTGLGGFLSRDLEVATMRGKYDHDALGVAVEYCAGADGWVSTAASLPGQDDGAVAYHSSGGMREPLAFVNPADLVGDYDLPLNMVSPLAYAGHTVVFRDDDEAYDHTRIKELVNWWVDASYP